jgi:hypothetical protein
MIHRCHADRESIRLKDGRTVHRSMDGAIWEWTERGQKTLANSGPEALKFLRSQGVNEERLYWLSCVVGGEGRRFLGKYKKKKR